MSKSCNCCIFNVPVAGLLVSMVIETLRTALFSARFWVVKLEMTGTKELNLGILIIYYGDSFSL